MIGISLPPFSEMLGNTCLLDTTDDESSEAKGKSPMDSTESVGKSTADTSDTSKDPTSSFRVGTIKASSSPSESVNADL